MTAARSAFRTAKVALAAWVAALFMAALPASADPLVVFAAASLKTALDDAAADFTAETGREVRISYGGSSALARQIEQGAPAGVFLSANAEWMDYLDAAGLLEPGTRVDLLTNTLVLIAPADSATSVDLSLPSSLGDALGAGRLAIALVDAVPAGVYGKAALQSLGLWDSVKDRLAQADNVRAALRLVAIGETPMGIVYATDAAAEPKVRIVATFADDTYPPILYPAAIVAEADDAAARAFLAYLQTDPARRIFAGWGFGFPGGGQ